MCESIFDFTYNITIRAHGLKLPDCNETRTIFYYLSNIYSKYYTWDIGFSFDDR